MNLADVTDSLKRSPVCESTLVSRIDEILKACECSKNMMISIYVLENDHFLYCNRELRKFMGNDCPKFLKEGWLYWFTRVDSNEGKLIKDQITNFFRAPHTRNTLILRYHISNSCGKRAYLKHEIRLHQMERHTLAINYLLDDSDKERIEHCFESTKNGDTKNSSLAKQLLHISEREKEVLRCVADGFSSKEIADMLFISNHTAISHRKNLIEKFNVRNTAQLIKKASKIMEL